MNCKQSATLLHSLQAARCLAAESSNISCHVSKNYKIHTTLELNYSLQNTVTDA